jgi:2-haloacid dehalogenase
MKPVAAKTIQDKTTVLAFNLWDTLLDRESTLVPALQQLLNEHEYDYDPVI